MGATIDLNCDVGEGVGNEALLFPFISSCNIAAGGHAGDADTMKAVASLAITHQVLIGAHPSYPDRPNFGRVSMELPKTEFQERIERQVNSLLSVLEPLNVKMHHIKAHGALYNDLAPGGRLAREYLEVMESFKSSHTLYAPCGSKFAKIGAALGFDIWEEAFADRAYRPDGSLVPRSVTGAVLSDPQEVAHQVLGMIRENQVKTSDGSNFSIRPETICIHGDNPQAVDILTTLADSLSKASINIKK